MAAASTMTVETVQVIRPIKIIALICAIIAFALLITGLAGNSWIEALNYKQGLWKVCIRDPVSDTEECTGPDPNSKAWLTACGALSIISLIVCVVVIILTAIGLSTKDHIQKYKFYRSATFLMFGAFVLQLIPLIIFPIMFIQDLDDKSAEMQITEWYFAWTYGIAWGAAIFEIGCAILLIIDKDREEIYYKEKTTY